MAMCGIARVCFGKWLQRGLAIAGAVRVVAWIFILVAVAILTLTHIKNA